ncbi:MAG: hypothetical protein KDD47_13050 [Acidobacteria bacterium]|nr:hypothetical protein [Acidobacteriota bacterium]
MTNVTHLLLADIRRMGAWIVLWIGLLVCQLRVVWEGIQPSPGRLVETVGAMGLHPWLLLLVWMPSMVAAGHPGKAQDFWWTRPAGRAQLLLAKGSFLFLFALVPMIGAQLLALVLIGTPSKHLPAALWEATIAEVALLSFWWLLAVLSRGLSSFFLALSCTVAAIFLALATAQVGWLTGESQLSDSLLSLFVGGRWPAGPAVAAGIAGIVVFAYLRRSLKVSASLLAVGLFAMAAIPSPWEGLVPLAGEVDPSRIQVSLLRDPQHPIRFSGRRGVVAEAHVSLQMTVENLPEGIAWHSTFSKLRLSTTEAAPAESSWRNRAEATDGERVADLSSSEGWKWSPIPPTGNRLEVVRQLVFPDGSQGPGEPVEASGFVSAELCEAKSVSMEGRVRLDLTSMELLGTLPLEEGSRFEEGDLRVILEGLDRKGDRVHFRLEASWLDSEAQRSRFGLGATWAVFLLERQGPGVHEVTSSSSGTRSTRLVAAVPRLLRKRFDEEVEMAPKEASGLVLAFLRFRPAGSREVVTSLDCLRFEGCQGYVDPIGGG